MKRLHDGPTAGPTGVLQKLSPGAAGGSVFDSAGDRPASLAFARGAPRRFETRASARLPEYISPFLARGYEPPTALRGSSCQRIVEDARARYRCEECPSGGAVLAFDREHRFELASALGTAHPEYADYEMRVTEVLSVRGGRSAARAHAERLWQSILLGIDAMNLCFSAEDHKATRENAHRDGGSYFSRVTSLFAEVLCLIEPLTWSIGGRELAIWSGGIPIAQYARQCGKTALALPELEALFLGGASAWRSPGVQGLWDAISHTFCRSNAGDTVHVYLLPNARYDGIYYNPGSTVNRIEIPSTAPARLCYHACWRKGGWVESKFEGLQNVIPFYQWGMRPEWIVELGENGLECPESRHVSMESVVAAWRNANETQTATKGFNTEHVELRLLLADDVGEDIETNDARYVLQR